MRFLSGRPLVLWVSLLILALGLPGLAGTPQAGTSAQRLVSADAGDGGRCGSASGGSADLESVLIRVSRPYGSVVQAIEAAGGTVLRQYKHFDGLAARVPLSALEGVRLLTGPGAITKDLRLPLPVPVDDLNYRSRGLVPTRDDRNVSFKSAQSIPVADFAGFAAAHPEAYLINNATSRVDTLHADGFAGQGIVVGVIDSGIRPGFPHLSLDGSVVGCEDFIGDGMGCSNFANAGHGTFVAGMISANVIFSFNPAGTFFRSVSAHLPAAIVAPNRIPMIGSAPLSSIYALRVCNEDGCFTSAILAAIDRAIDLRDRSEAGEPDGVKVQVVNISLGGPTLFAGHDIFDTAVDALLAHDIVVATSAGNAGPSGLTSGSPASSLSSISVGAASIAGYEQIVADLQFGFGIGSLFRPTNHIQTASFSSRGPHADGRRSPDVTANGDWDYGQGFSATTGGINFAGGTSFSSPTVAGVAAVLRQAFPGATARQITNAIIDSANPGLLGDGSGPQDQGNGFVDAGAARAMLAGGSVPDALPAPPAAVKSVKNNIETNAGLTVRNGLVQETFGPLKPGQRGEIIYEVTPNTAQVVINVSNFSAALPPDQQNQLFGDDLFFTVHSAKTSRQPGTSGYFFQGFITGGQLVLDNPEPGLIRVTTNGDWTNAGDVTANVTIFSVAEAIPGLTAQGKIHEGDQLVRTVAVSPGTSVAEFRLGWREDYSHYPTGDVDLVLIDPDGNLNFEGASLDAPEVVSIADPKPGTWVVVLLGFELHTPDDKFELRVSLDGSVVH
ncbi:MAG: S8 family serine peptidase [Acidobacteria bacterium]|nr:S8 family serine peptidase [Acidobacteriota bacterium]